MRNRWGKIYRWIVGYEFGFSGEGNEQWYYFLGLVMNIMLTWWLKPELGLVFTIAAGIHFLSINAYGLKAVYYAPDEVSIVFPTILFGLHLVLFIVCLCFSWSWALITSAVVIVGFILAPNCMGNNILMPEPKKYKVYFGNNNNIGILFFHTLWFVAFVVITLCLPIVWYLKLAIIIVCMILHPVIDTFEGEGVIISDIIEEAVETIIDYFKNKKNSKKAFGTDTVNKGTAAMAKSEVSRRMHNWRSIERVVCLFTAILAFTWCFTYLFFDYTDLEPASKESIDSITERIEAVSDNPELMLKSKGEIKIEGDTVTYSLENADCKATAKYDREFKLIEYEIKDSAETLFHAIVVNGFVGMFFAIAGFFIAFIVMYALSFLYFYYTRDYEEE